MDYADRQPQRQPDHQTRQPTPNPADQKLTGPAYHGAVKKLEADIKSFRARGVHGEADRLSQKLIELKKPFADLYAILEKPPFLDYADSTISAATQELYSRKMSLMEKAKQGPIEYCTRRGLGQSTYQTMRAALLHDSVKNIKQLLDAADPNADQARVLKVARRADKLTGDKYEPERDPTKERRALEQGRVSKRKTLRGLPDDWREKIHDRMYARGSRYASAALVVHHTGCRPAELEKGVMVRHEGDAITLTIYGAKQSEKNRSGQEWRVISYPAESDQGLELFAKVLRGGSAEMVVLPGQPQAFLKAYKWAASKSIDGVKGRRISPYSARHQFAADMKRNGYSRTQIAEAMGHQSTKSQSQYGGAGQGGGGGKSLSAEASSPVRDNARDPLKTMSISSGPSMS